MAPELEVLLHKLFAAMIRFDRGDAKRIQHFTKVYAYAKLIGEEEGLDEQTLFTLEAAALTHDIGILVAERKYGHQNGKLQEQEGPAPAGEMLAELGFPEETIRRVQYLIGHHHTYDAIDGEDYQILVEADFIVNLFEDGEPEASVRAARDRIFRTQAGTALLDDMFGLS